MTTRATQTRRADALRLAGLHSGSVLLRNVLPTRHRMDEMNDATITCPHCHTEIKLTESLAAPLLETTRQQYEKRLSDKDAEEIELIEQELTTPQSPPKSSNEN